MPVILSLLRAVNVGGRNMIKMDVLRELYGSLGLRHVQTYVQSGNVVFRAGAQAPAPLQKKIQNAIERKAGFRPEVVLRSVSEWKAAIAANPFPRRAGNEPGKLLVLFLAGAPAPEARKALLKLPPMPEKMELIGRELFLDCPNGAGQVKLPWTRLEKILQVPGTARNWNTVTKLLEIAETLEAED